MVPGGNLTEHLLVSAVIFWKLDLDCKIFILQNYYQMCGSVEFVTVGKVNVVSPGGCVLC